MAWGALRRELIEIACSNGVSDPEGMRDLLLASLSGGCVDDEAAFEERLRKIAKAQPPKDEKPKKPARRSS
jgi:hypothetical protein